ncbi:MAG: cation-transporting P-type ATPase [Hyphomicrobiales bacterium]|nr:cation-transporting P-type ATPase [Hyphomicrobiales bacterium]
MARTGATGDPGFHALGAEDVLARLAVDPATGLSDAEAAARLRLYGPNLMRVRKPISAWRILINQFESAVVLLLAAAAGLSAVFGEWPQAIAVAIVLAINSAIGFFTEIRAVRSMEALRELGAREARIRRGGAARVIAAGRLVPGDIVLLDGGDLVPADLRLVSAANLACDESTLTGESLPVDKQVALVAADTPMPERISMAYKGTAVTRGSGEAVVTATGLATELGRITALVEEAEQDRSPLEKQLERLSRQLIWVTLVLAGMITVAGIVTGNELLLMVEAGIALAVAAIPEGLPIVATLTLARGMLRMARKNALVERLSAVETLGATTVILTDKTGTLTENRMRLDRLLLAGGEVIVDYTSGQFLRDDKRLDPATDLALQRALEIGVLCTNATLGGGLTETGEDGDTGDPTEIALLRAGQLAGLTRAGLTASYPELAEIAFDSAAKRMATIHQDGETFLFVAKGAPETVLPACQSVLTGEGADVLNESQRDDWLDAAESLAARGLRMLALAFKQTDNAGAPVYQGLTLAGLAAIHDPPRSDISEAIQACRDAGITVIMVTGDHIGTAKSVSEAIGLSERGARARAGHELAPMADADDVAGGELRRTIIFARVTPEQKLDLIRLHQQAGEVVAMTGDGVNDAPALRQADIGVAMGLRGTQVAREAADIVLRDDAFATIVTAIREGRVIFANIRRFATYLLSCNLAEVLIVGLAVLAGLPLPLLPLQILFLNLVTDVFPAFALGLGEGDENVLKRPPRDPAEGLLTRRQWRAIVFFGALITAATLGALLIALTVLELEGTQAVTVSFLTLAFAQLWHVFNLRSTTVPLWRNDVVRNPYVWGALGLCIALLLAAAYFAPLAAVLEIVAPDRAAWLLILAMSAAPVMVGEIVRAFMPAGVISAPA